ncbi:MAG: hypothetical protein ACQEQE_05580 [Bacillota bacterium]
MRFIIKIINNSGSLTLEAAIVIPIVLIILIFLISSLINVYLKGIIEIKANNYQLHNKEIKEKITYKKILHKNKTTLKTTRLKEDFLKGILLEKFLVKVGDYFER